MTREKAIYILETYPEDKSSWEETIEAFKFAANALRHIPQWLSVEEKLPEDEQEQEQE